MNPALYTACKLIILAFYAVNLAAYVVPFPDAVSWLFPLSGIVVIAIHAAQLLIYRSVRGRSGAKISRDDVIGILLYGMLYIRANAKPTDKQSVL